MEYLSDTLQSLHDITKEQSETDAAIKHQPALDPKVRDCFTCQQRKSVLAFSFALIVIAYLSPEGTINDGSCNKEASCYGIGSSAVIGKFSCNGSSGCSGTTGKSFFYLDQRSCLI
jgi:hypothetical protein